MACVVVDLEQVPLLRRPSATRRSNTCANASGDACGRFGPSVGVLGVGPGTFRRCRCPTINARARCISRGVRAGAARGQRLPVVARLGIAVAAPGEGADSMLNLAEGAAGAARDSALPFVVYDGDLRETARDQIELLADAATAIHSGGLHVAYQSQRDLTNGSFVGVEALARWRHPERGDIPPSVFVPLAERMGLVDELGRCVLRTACVDWRGAAPVSSDLACRSTCRPRSCVMSTIRTGSHAHSAMPTSRRRHYGSRSPNRWRSTSPTKSEARSRGSRISVSGCRSTTSVPVTPRSPVSRACRGPRSSWTARSPPSVSMCEAARCRAIIAFGTALDIEVMAEGIETSSSRRCAPWDASTARAISSADPRRSRRSRDLNRTAA